jgi:hypothetical protein
MTKINYQLSIINYQLSIINYYPRSSSNKSGKKIAKGNPQKLVTTSITANRIEAIASSGLNNPIKLREVIVLRRELMTRLILLGRFW